MKYFLGLVVGLLPAIASVSGAITFNSSAIAQSCANYWVNPQTGKQECLTVTSKPSFQYLGKMNSTSRKGKRTTIKFYAERNIVVTNGLSKPVNQVTTFSSGHRFENVVVIDCNNYAIAYISVNTKLNGKLINSEKYETLEFEAISDVVDARTYNYICKGTISKN